MTLQALDGDGQVLIVEDDPLIASFMMKALARHGLAPRSVSTGAEALAAVEDGGVRLVLLDLGLPDVDGLEVLRRLRLVGSRVPVVVVTSRSDPADRATAHRLGIDGYLMKPFPLAELLRSVTESLGQARPGS